MNKTFSSKSNARRAALASLGVGAVEAEDFKVTQGADGRWTWNGLEESPGDSPSAKSRSRRPPRAEGTTRTSESGKGKGDRDTKQARLVAMLHKADGATVDEIAAAFGWQKHTVRGAIAGALKKKLGLDVTSEKIGARGRVYRIAG